MKRWVKVHIKDKNKDVDLVCRAFNNYLFQYGPIQKIYQKYNISEEDKREINQYTANRIAGLLMLYLSKNYKRINDIANKYNLHISTVDIIEPEIEGYIDK